MLGDVILVISKSKFAPINTLAQRILSMHWRPREEYTHVAMGFGEWLAIHAMPNPWHVEVVGIHELLVPGTTWRVWRNAALAASLENISRREKLHYEMCGALGSSYNALFVMKDAADSSFCSQLVGRFASTCGHPFDRGSRVLMPLDIFEVVSSSDAWHEVTKEYKARLDGDDDYKRLHENPNERDAQAFYASYLVSKGNLNQILRGERAAFDGLLPHSRVNVQRDGAMRVLSYSVGKERDEIGLDLRRTVDLPGPYEGSTQAWDDKLDVLPERLDKEDFVEMRELLKVPRQERADDFPESTWTHDAVVVLVRRDLAKAAAVLFDAVLPLGTDLVAKAAIAFGAPTAFQVNPTLFADRLRIRRQANHNAPIVVHLRDGTPLHAAAGDRDAEETMLARMIEKAYLGGKPGMVDGVMAKLDDANLGESSLLLPGPCVATSDAEEAAVWHLELVGVPVVDTEALSWDQLTDLRRDPGVMAGCQGLRRLLTNPRPKTAADIERDVADGCRSLEVLAAAKSVPLRRAVLGLLFTDTFPIVGRLSELLALFPDDSDEHRIDTPNGPVIFRVTQADSDLAEVVESHRHVLTLVLQDRGAG